MSFYYSAQLIYGVHLTEEEVTSVRKHPNWENIRDMWVVNADFTTNDAIIVGFVKKGIPEGTITELKDINEPRTKDLEDLLEVLDTLNINREPTWHLVCSVE